MLSRFHLLIPERHGQTDGRRRDRRTDRYAISISCVSVLTRDKMSVTWRWPPSGVHYKENMLHFRLFLAVSVINDISTYAWQSSIYVKRFHGRHNRTHTVQVLMARALKCCTLLMPIARYTSSEHGFATTFNRLKQVYLA